MLAWGCTSLILEQERETKILLQALVFALEKFWRKQVTTKKHKYDTFLTLVTCPGIKQRFASLISDNKKMVQLCLTNVINKASNSFLLLKHSSLEFIKIFLPE